ncbi:MAG: aminotransferase class I/II-fold pyridoxal phosphate-dependent enzyme [Ruminococcus sp.]|nr:aminotransferase class I/II-fold pyridoxal phosphate-dependent enzyme [Ruminococcus sp.]
MLFEKLKEYSNSGIYPFHMPGHKRTDGNGLPFDIDITEIDGFDNLHEPRGCLHELQKNAAELFGSRYAFALVNGSTVGILAAVRAMTKDSDKVLIARNCHMAVYHAVELCRLDAEYYLPDTVDGLGIFACVSPEAIEQRLSADPAISLVVITSPTYEGIVSDVGSIAAICRKHGARLLVDEAHGAHFPFSDKFPQSAIQCGADAAVTSLHKTLPSMTQTALLLTNSDELAQEMKRQLSVFETSSPSYVLLASIDRCLGFLKHSQSAFDAYTKRLTAFYEAAGSLRHLSVPYERLLKSQNVFDFDMGKLCIFGGGCMSGKELMDILRSDYHIELEMALGDYALAMTSVCDTDEGFDRLLNALREIDSRCSGANHTAGFTAFSLPQKHCTISEAVNKDGEMLDLYKAEGKVSREYVRVYPPGIPMIVPGEVIDRDILSRLRELEASGNEILTDSSAFPLISIIS